MRGAAKREQAVRSAIEEHERERDRVRLEEVMEEVTVLSRTMQPKIEELAASVVRISGLEEEGLALAGKLGVRLRPKGTKKYVRDLLYERLGGRVMQNFGPRQPLSWVRKAEEGLQQPWRPRA